jgi:hypothetical protein
MDKEILEKIENPIVKRAIEKRCGGFMFNYGDHKEGRATGVHGVGEWYTEAGKTGYKEYCEGFLYKEAYSSKDYNDMWKL